MPTASLSKTHLLIICWNKKAKLPQKFLKKFLKTLKLPNNQNLPQQVKRLSETDFRQPFNIIQY